MPVVTMSKSKLRDTLLEKLAGFSIGKSGEFEIPLNWILRDPQYQPRDQDDLQQVEVLLESMKKVGQDDPMLVFLNPDRTSDKPFILYGGNHRYLALVKKGDKKGVFRYNHNVNTENAIDYAFRNNCGKKMALGEEIRYVKLKFAKFINEYPTAEQKDKADEALRKIVPVASQCLRWVKLRYALSTLHIDVLKRILLPASDPDNIPRQLGVYISRLPHEAQQELVPRLKDLTSRQTARLINDYLEKHCSAEDGIGSWRTGASPATSNRQPPAWNTVPVTEAPGEPVIRSSAALPIEEQISAMLASALGSSRRAEELIAGTGEITACPALTRIQTSVAHLLGLSKKLAVHFFGTEDVDPLVMAREAARAATRRQIVRGSTETPVRRDSLASGPRSTRRR